VFVVPASITAASKWFQVLITLSLKKCCLRSDTHSRFLPLLVHVLPFYDDIYKHSASFVITRLMSDCVVVRSVAEYRIFTSGDNSVLAALGAPLSIDAVFEN